MLAIKTSPTGQSPLAMAEFFNPEEYRACYPEGIEQHFWNLARNALLLRLIRGLDCADGLVMDVGCGPGIFLAYVQGRGVDARGVELGRPDVLPSVQDKVDVGTDLFMLDSDLRASIRTVLLLDVIEHMSERREFLRRINRELPSCEHLVITVPARSEIWSDYDRDWGHCLRYDRPALRDDLTGTGYTPSYMSYHFQSMYLAMLVMKVLGIRRSSEYRSPTRNPLVAAAHRALGGITQMESWLLPGCLPGSSLVCVASRAPGS